METLGDYCSRCGFSAVRGYWAPCLCPFCGAHTCDGSPPIQEGAVGGESDRLLRCDEPRKEYGLVSRT